MGRRSYYDTDEERLPEGMCRIGYDADDQTYTFRDKDGSIWQSAPGNRYGRLHRISKSPARSRSRSGSASSSGSDASLPPGVEPAATVLVDNDHDHEHELDEGVKQFLSGGRRPSTKTGGSDTPAEKEKDGWDKSSGHSSLGSETDSDLEKPPVGEKHRHRRTQQRQAQISQPPKAQLPKRRQTATGLFGLPSLLGSVFAGDVGESGGAGDKAAKPLGRAKTMGGALAAARKRVARSTEGI